MSETLGPALGRISGKLLKDNLLRDGVNLSFRNNPTDEDLLYIDVVNRRVGINTATPVYDLDIDGTTNIVGQVNVVGTSAILDQISINLDGSITSISGPIIIAPSGPDAYVLYEKVLTPNIEVNDNYISNTSLNQNLRLDPSGTGKVDILSNAKVNGNLDVTGNINTVGNVSLDGAITIGDSPLDTIVIAPDFTQSVVPGDDVSYNLGSSLKKWADVHSVNVGNITNFNVSTLKVSDQIQITGQTISSLQSNNEIVITSDSGTVQLERLNITGSTVTNLNNTPITLSSTGTGYVKMLDNNAMVVPVGAYGTSPTSPGVAVGETRWNTDRGYLECFDGTVWQSSLGGGTIVSAPIMEELGHVYTLIFG